MLNTPTRAFLLSTGVLMGLSTALTPTAQAQESKPRDLTYQEATSLIEGFGASWVEADSPQTVTLNGWLPADCQKEVVQFKVEKTSFRIHLPQGYQAFKRCVDGNQANLKEHDKNRLSTSNLPGTRIGNAHTLSGEVKFCFLPHNTEPKKDECVSFVSPVKLKTEEEAQREREAVAKKEKEEREAEKKAEEKRKEDRKEALRKNIEKIIDNDCVDCRRDRSKVSEVFAEIEDLVSIDLLDESDAKAYRKSLGNAEFSHLEDRLERISADDVSALERLDGDTREWTDRYEEFEKSKEAGLRLRMDIAKKMTDGAKDVGGSSEGLRAARAIYEDIDESSAASAAQRREARDLADGVKQDIVASEIAEHVESEVARGSTPASIQQSLVENRSLKDYQRSLEREMSSACTTRGGSRSFQRCAELRQRYTTQQSRMQVLVQQQLSMSQILYQQQQMDLMRQQQEAQMRSFMQPGGFMPGPMPGPMPGMF